MSSGAAGEVDQAGGSPNVGGEALVDAWGDEDGVFEAVEALPSVVDIGESGVGGRVSWGSVYGAALAVWGWVPGRPLTLPSPPGETFE